MVNEKTSSTGGPSVTGETAKFRHSIAVTILISSIARCRPGQKRAPAPNGRNAWVSCPGRLRPGSSSQRSGRNACASAKFSSSRANFPVSR